MCMTHWKMGLLFLESKNSDVSRLATQPLLLHLPPLQPQRHGLAKFGYSFCTSVPSTSSSVEVAAALYPFSSSRRVHLLNSGNNNHLRCRRRFRHCGSCLRDEKVLKYSSWWNNFLCSILFLFYHYAFFGDSVTRLPKPRYRLHSTTIIINIKSRAVETAFSPLP